MRNALADDESGYQLLHAVRAYVEMDLLASYEVHTDISIKQGRAAVQKFVKLANVSNLFCTQMVSLSNNVVEFSALSKGFRLELPKNASNPTPI